MNSSRPKRTIKRSPVDRNGGTSRFPTRPPRRVGGSVLLEVIFSIALFASAGAAVLAGFNSCFQAMREMRLEAKAADLAVSKLAEIQMGAVAIVDDGPTEYADPDAQWTWQIVTADVDPSAVTGAKPETRVTIIITYVPESLAFSLTHLVPRDWTGVSASATGGAS